MTKRSFKQVLDQNYTWIDVNEASFEDSFAEPADLVGNQKKYIVYMDVANVTEDGKRMPPQTGAFIDQPYDDFESAFQAAINYAKKRYPVSAGNVISDPQDDGDQQFITIVSEPTSTSKASHKIKMYVKKQFYYNQHSSDSMASGGKVVVDLYEIASPTKCADSFSYPSIDDAIKGIKTRAMSLQKSKAEGIRTVSIAPIGEGKDSGTSYILELDNNINTIWTIRGSQLNKNKLGVFEKVITASLKPSNSSNASNVSNASNAKSTGAV